MKLKVAREELEVERYLNQEQQAEHLGEYDLLYSEIARDSSAREDEITADSATPLDADASDEDQASLESLKERQYHVASESWEGVAEFTKKTIENLKVFTRLGLHYGIPILRYAYKGVIYALSHLVIGLLNSIEVLNTVRIRITQSFESSQKDLQSLRQALEAIETPKAIEDQFFTRPKIINALKISDQVDLTANINTLESFISTNFKAISDSINSDVSAIKRMIAYVVSGTVKAPFDILSHIPMKEYLEKGALPGFEEQSDLIESYLNPQSLPGDVNLTAYLPKAGIDNIDQISQAYNASSLFLGFNQAQYQEINQIPYLSKEELSEFLVALNKLCESASHHVDMYYKIGDGKKSLKYNFRLYIRHVLEVKKKMSISDTLVDHINLKSLFIDKVYIAAASDLHIYTIKVVTAGLQFAKDNITKLS